MGRPSSYKSEYAEQARKLCALGATDVDIADFFDVSDRTIYRWQAQFPEFCRALKVGKEGSDDRVERSLYHRAVGYTFDSEKVQVLRDGQIVRVPIREHVAPDTTACIFWLKNRRADVWRDVQRHEIGSPGEFAAMTDEALTEQVQREAAELGVPTNETAH